MSLLKNRLIHLSSKGLLYKEKYGSQASFNSYIEGFESFQLDEDKLDKVDVSTSSILAAEIEKQPPKIDFTENSSKDSAIPSESESLKPKNIGTNNYSSKVSRQALESLQTLRKGNNLEKFLEAHGLSMNGSGYSVSELKQAFDKFLSKQEEEKQQNEISKWANQIEDLRALRNEKELEKWLESKGVPAANVSVAAVQKELQKYFQNSESNAKNRVTPKIVQPTWGKRSGNKGALDKSGNKSGTPTTSEEQIAVAVAKIKEVAKIEKIPDPIGNVDNILPPLKRTPRDFGPCMKVEEFNGRSILLREDTLAHKLWEDFKGMSTPKQIAVVVGITVVTAALGFVSWQILILAFPSAFQVNRYWTEILAQWFIQRQESTFHLLQHTAQNAKPLSTAWANQYLLWKYI